MDEKQAIALLWDEWKYRHGLFWRLFVRCAGSVITLWVIPFLKPDVFKPFPFVSLVFPLLAFVLSVLSVVLFFGEQRRFAMVNEKYNELRRCYEPPRWPKRGFVNRLASLEIGVVLVWFYGVGFALASIGVGVLLLKTVGPVDLPGLLK